MHTPDHASGFLRAGTPARLGPVTLLPVERVTVCARAHEHGAWIAASLEPVAVVVRDALGVRAIGVDSTALSLPALLEELPALAAALRAP